MWKDQRTADIDNALEKIKFHRDRRNYHADRLRKYSYIVYGDKTESMIESNLKEHLRDVFEDADYDFFMSRTKNNTIAKKMFVYIVMKKYNIWLSRIANMLGLVSHWSIIYLRDQANKLMETDSDFREKYNIINNKLEKSIW